MNGRRLAVSTPEETPEKAPRVSKRLLAIIVAVVVVISGLGVASYYLFFSKAANVAPTAAFNVTSVNNRVIANASASSDPDGSIKSYAWDFGDGATGTSVEASHSYLAEGNFSITLTVTDDGGATGVKSKAVVIALRPVPAFSADVSLLRVDVDATKAFALRGSLASYSWDWGDSSSAGTGRLANHTYAAAGNYTVRLTVTDTNGKSATGSQKLAVHPTSTIYTRMYDFCQPTFQRAWYLRNTVYGDIVLRNTPPATEEYPWGFYEGYANHDTSLYCLYRERSHGVNVPNYDMSRPVFYPYLAPFSAAPSSQGPFDNTSQALSSLAAADGTAYAVNPGKTMWLGSFDIAGHSEKPWSASLEVRYAAPAGLNASAAIRWSPEGSGNDTLTLKLRSTGGATTWVTDWITLSPAKVSSFGVVSTLNVSFKNPSASASVYIDQLKILVYHDAPAPAADQGSVKMNLFINYATEQSESQLTKLGYFDTSGVDDGFVSDLRGTYTMDYVTSQKVFGVSGDPASWWANESPVALGYGQSRDSPLERAWANWFTWNGNVKYDVFDGFEYFFQVFTMEVNATVVNTGLTNQTVVNFRLVAWGGEVLLARWFYWGPASYMAEPGPDLVYDEKVNNDDIASTPLGWNGEEIGWWENTFFNATLSSHLNYTLDGVTAYQFAAGAGAGTDGVYKTGDDTPNWNWQSYNMDYVNETAHPRSEIRYYWENNLSYLHTVPGSYYYGQPYVYDYAPVRWNLRPGETLVLQMPMDLMIWYDPAKSVWDPTLQAGKGAPRYAYYFAPLTVGEMDPTNAGLWDEAIKTVSLSGPFPMPNDGHPPLSGLPSITFIPARG